MFYSLPPELCVNEKGGESRVGIIWEGAVEEEIDP